MLNKAMEQVKRVAITGHVRPDGDCVGSCMGLFRYLKDNYPEVTVDLYLEEIPEKFRFIEGTDEILHELSSGEPYDLLICVDTSDPGRLGFAEPLIDMAAHTMCIDHHISNLGFADENLINPDKSSASELVYGLLDKDKITRDIAQSLYMGIVHDTGVFQYSCTSPETMRVAADLMETGFDAPKLIDQTFYEKNYAQTQILGRALLESSLLMNGHCVATHITKKQMEFYGVTPADLDGIVEQLREIKGVEVAIFGYEQEACLYKISLRSKSFVDVSKVASFFGGGGHVRAAGCTISGSIYDVLNNILDHIALQIDEEQ